MKKYLNGLKQKSGVVNLIRNILEGWFNFFRYYTWPPYKKRMQFLFNQRLEILRQIVLFDKQTITEGTVYTCTDGHYVYTLYLTVNNELFFYTKEKEMIKLILKPVIAKTI